MTELHRWMVTVALLGGCTLHPHDGDGGFGDGGDGGGEDDDADPETTGISDESSSADEDSSGGDPPDPDSGGADTTTSAGDSSGAGDESPGETGAPDDLSECSNFTSVDQMFTYVNTERGTYGGMFGGMAHQRYKGYPWSGEGHDSFTFSVQFAWDDGLAATAQAAADALASGGGNPSGHQQNGTNGLPICPFAPFWIDGINTGAWAISFAEQPAHWLPGPHPGSCPANSFSLDPSNQHARMGLHYHDFGGDGPAINSLGIGAAVIPDDGTGECKVWWVLQFGT